MTLIPSKLIYIFKEIFEHNTLIFTFAYVLIVFQNILVNDNKRGLALYYFCITIIYFKSDANITIPREVY